MILPTYEFFYGIDPGAKGALACINADGTLKFVEDLPDNDEDWVGLLQYPTKLYNTLCALEDVHALPRQSTVAGFTFGKNVGKAELLATLLSTIEDPVLVTPQKWKKFFGLDKDKHKSVDLARELFPTAEELLLYSKDGRAEALLIAEYCRQTYKGEYQ